MKKKCPLCQVDIKDGDTVVVLLLAKYVQKDGAYDLQVSSQTISSHLFCVEKPTEVIPNAL